jgi:4-hydroxy-tetrahydrodipicolinate synthase
MPKLDHTAGGVYAIAATPFHADGRLDLASLDRLTDFYVEKGATGLTILGIMGEAGKLEMEESLEITRRVVARAPVPVDRKSTRLNSSHNPASRMPSSA